MKSFVAAVVGFGVAAIVGTATPAAAHDDWHHRGGWHHGPRSGIYFGFGAPLFYPPPPPMVVYRYAPPPPVVYVTPPPQVVYASPPSVSAVPASPVYTDSWGRSCREYQTTVNVGGMAQPSYGTACLEPDGSWHIVR
jgi:hypothetical protein